MALSVQKVGSVSVIAAALFAASWGAQAAVADAASATVNITAEIVGKTCTPSWKAGTAVSVDLGKVSTGSLAAAGDVGSLKPFTLSLKDCDSGVTKVAVEAAGTADSDDASAFANTAASGAATGVAVTLFGGEEQSKQLTPDSSKVVEYTVTDGAADMTFLAKLERTTSEAVTEGKVSSTATLYMTYE